jgi:hypothetical protein
MDLRIVAVVGVLSALLSGSAASAATGTPSPAPSATASAAAPAQSPYADPATRAREWLHRMQTGDIDRSQLTDEMNTDLTPGVIKQISDQFGPLGDPQSFTLLGEESVAGDETAYVYRVVFKTKTVNEVFVLDKAGKVAGIQFPPAQ